MRKLMIVAALAVPMTALANGTPNPRSPGAHCRAERNAAATVDNFKSQYGTPTSKLANALGKCVSRWTRLQQQNKVTASRQCRTEQADSNFAATHEGKTFAQQYGVGQSGRNAFGRCVSQKANAKTAQQQQAALKAVRRCRSLQRNSATEFQAQFGTRFNAFGKCVSTESRA
jgi:hypothetical protein